MFSVAVTDYYQSERREGKRRRCSLSKDRDRNRDKSREDVDGMAIRMVRTKKSSSSEMQIREW